MTFGIRQIVLAAMMAATAAAQEGDRLIVTGSAESGNSIYGAHYGRPEGRYSLGYDFSKRDKGIRISSQLTADLSTIEGLYFSRARAAVSDIGLGQLKLSFEVGDISTRLTQAAAGMPGMVRGLGWGLDWRWLGWSFWAGTPYEMFRANSSLASRSAAGTMLSARPAPWVRQGLFLAGHSFSEDRDSLNRSSLTFGSITDIYPRRQLDLSFTAAWKRRTEARTPGNLIYGSPYLSSAARWSQSTGGISGRMEYFGRNYQAWNPRRSVWLSLGTWYRPTGLTRFSGNYSNQNAGGDTAYPWITSTWDLGTNLNLPKLPQINLKYYSSDQRLDWGGPDPRRYATIERTYEASQSIWKVDGRISYRLTDRDERVRNLSAFRMETFRVRPVFRWGRYMAWPSCEFENWRDLKSSNDGRTLRLRAGGEAGWNRWASKITAEVGVNSERVMWGPRQVRWVADLQLRANITPTYLLSLAWWNESNVAQDTGFFYRPDYNRFKLTLSRTFDLSGNRVEGLVYLDRNQNGRQDRDEPGLPGIRVVTTTGQAALTDAKGWYAMPNIRNGRATLKLDLATVSAEYNIIGQYEKSLPLGGWRRPRADFPLSALGGVKGRVFFDRNKNGSFDADDHGVSGVMLMLMPSGLTAVSNGGGAFRFSNVPTGDQQLTIDTVSAPAEYEPLTSGPVRVIVRQGEIVNHLEIAMTKRFRPVKRTVFDGEMTVPLISIPEARAAELPKPTRPEVKPAQPRPRPQPSTTAPKLSKEEIDALYRDGTRLFSAGEYQQALRIWQRILNADPAHANARRNLERTRQKLEALKRTKG
jgi:hypothetical protein